MFKNLLIASAALLTAGTASAFAPKTTKVESDQFSFFPGNVELQQSLKTRAGEDSPSIDFSISDQPYTAYRLNNVSTGSEVHFAFRLSEENATVFADDVIKSINIWTGTSTTSQPYKNTLTDVTLFILDDLEGEPVYTQEAKLGTAGFTEYKIDLTEPYKIEAGKELYIGYYFKIPNAQQYYLTVDGFPTTDPDGCFVGLVSNGKVAWDNYADEIGSICLGCTIAGENFPQNNVILTDLSGPTYAQPGETFNYLFLIQNKGFSASSVEFTYKIGEEAAQSITQTFDTPLTYNQYQILTVPMACNTEGMDVPMNFTITKVNGAENNAKNPSITSGINCFEKSKGFPRVSVIEEGTGTWCGWCPRGMVMMEYAAATYPEKFALVALHANGTTADPMQPTSALNLIQSLFASFPSAYINRTYNLENMTTADIDAYVTQYGDQPSAVEFTELTAGMTGEGSLKADAKVRFAFDITNNNRYRLAYYLTENNVGPYNQTNYYSGGSYGAMGGWEKKGSSVRMYYNDVCRYLLGGATGLTNSLPAAIKAQEEIGHTADIPTSTITGAKFYLTAFIVDNQSGEIVNAKQIEVENPYAGVEDIAIDANAVSKKYYNMNGVEVKDPSNGIFIVRTTYSDGSIKTSKESLK